MSHTRGSAAMSISGGGFQPSARRQVQQSQPKPSETKTQTQPPPSGPAGSVADPTVAALAEQTEASQYAKENECKWATAVSEAVQTVLPSAAAWLPAVTDPSAPDAPPDQQQHQPVHQPGAIRADSPNASNSDADAESDGEEGGGDSYVISEAEVLMAQRLQADHKQRGERIDQLQAEADQWRSKVDRLQGVVDALEKERMDESASHYASSEQLRSDLAWETQQHSTAKVQLAQRGQELLCVSRERDLLSASLRQHESELRSTGGVIASLRQRCEVLEAIQAQMEADQAAAARADDAVVSVDDSGSGSEGVTLELPDGAADVNASDLIPALAASTAPLHLRRSRLHALLLQRTVQERKVVRLETDLEVARRDAQSHRDAIAGQWEQLSALRDEMAALQLERDRADAAVVQSQTHGQIDSAPSAAAAFSASASTSSLLLQLHQLEERARTLELHNRNFLRSFYLRVAVWCVAVLVACAAVAALTA